MAGGRPRGTGLRVGIPTCPRHRGGHVVRNGHYGKAEIRRQLYLYAPSGVTPHTFAGSLPRRTLAGVTKCDTRETHLAPHQGSPTPRHYTFSVREAAAALIAVASGVTYTQGAITARLRAGRPRQSRGYGARQVGNWV